MRALPRGLPSRTRLPRVLLSGWYGHGNVGDEALLHGIAASVRRAERPVDLVVLSDDPDHTTRTTGLPAIRRPRRSASRRELARILLRADLFALGGGGLIKDYGQSPSNMHHWLTPMMTAAKLRRRTMTYAVGVDDVRYPESRELMRRTLSRATHVTARDRGSIERMAREGYDGPALLSADPALLVEPSRRVRRDPALVGVALRHWFATGRHLDDPDRVDAAMRELAHALDRLVDVHDARILFVPFREHDADNDATIARLVLGAMARRDRAAIAAVPDRPADAVELLGACDLVVAQRLHAAILAASTTTPFFAISYMPKVDYFARDAGLGERQATLEQAATPGHLASALDAAYSERDALRSKLESTIPAMKRRAQLTGELLAATAHGDERQELLAADLAAAS